MCGQVMGDGEDQEETQGQGELEDLAEEVHPVGLEEQLPLLEQAKAGDHQAAGGQGQGDLVVRLDLRLAPQAEAERRPGPCPGNRVPVRRASRSWLHSLEKWDYRRFNHAHHHLREEPEKDQGADEDHAGQTQEGADVFKVHELGVRLVEEGVLHHPQGKQRPHHQGGDGQKPCTG